VPKGLGIEERSASLPSARSSLLAGCGEPMRFRGLRFLSTAAGPGSGSGKVWPGLPAVCQRSKAAELRSLKATAGIGARSMSDFKAVRPGPEGEGPHQDQPRLDSAPIFFSAGIPSQSAGRGRSAGPYYNCLWAKYICQLFPILASHSV